MLVVVDNWEPVGPKLLRLIVSFVSFATSLFCIFLPHAALAQGAGLKKVLLSRSVAATLQEDVCYWVFALFQAERERAVVRESKSFGLSRWDLSENKKFKYTERESFGESGLRNSNEAGRAWERHR